MQIQERIKLTYSKKRTKLRISHLEMFSFGISSSFIQGGWLFLLILDSFCGVAGLKTHLWQTLLSKCDVPSRKYKNSTHPFPCGARGKIAFRWHRLEAIACRRESCPWLICPNLLSGNGFRQSWWCITLVFGVLFFPSCPELSLITRFCTSCYWETSPMAKSLRVLIFCSPQSSSLDILLPYILLGFVLEFILMAGVAWIWAAMLLNLHWRCFSSFVLQIFIGQS